MVTRFSVAVLTFGVTFGVTVWAAPPSRAQDNRGNVSVESDVPVESSQDVTTAASSKDDGSDDSLAGADVEVYKSVDGIDLAAYIFKPKQHRPEDRSPAIVFFFGGGWKSGDPRQFAPHCQLLADRGMVAVTVDYRVSSRHSVKAVECVRDAKSAVRWLRANADRLGIDSERIVAAGGSAGGHLAACTAVVKQFDASNEDASISSVPNALALFNPAVVLASIDGRQLITKNRQKELDERMGVASIELSPYHQLAGKAPPAIIFHGKADKTVPYETVELFTDVMQQAGNRCELVGFEGQGHGFFNSNRNQSKNLEQTMQRLDAFLVSLGYLE